MNWSRYRFRIHCDGCGGDWELMEFIHQDKRTRDILMTEKRIRAEDMECPVCHSSTLICRVEYKEEETI